MSHSVADLTNERNLGIRASYITGHFDRDTALARIQFGGFATLTEETKSRSPRGWPR